MSGASESPSDRGREACRAQVAVRVHYRFDPQGAFDVAEAVDLSASGVLVRCDGDGRVGSMVHVRLALPDGNGTVEGFGRVARSGTCQDGGPAMAIQFLSLDAQAIDLLERLVEGRLQATEVGS
jgi:hypothetical protein